MLEKVLGFLIHFREERLEYVGFFGTLVLKSVEFIVPELGLESLPQGVRVFCLGCQVLFGGETYFLAF